MHLSPRVTAEHTYEQPGQIGDPGPSSRSPTVPVSATARLLDETLAHYLETMYLDIKRLRQRRAS